MMYLHVLVLHNVPVFLLVPKKIRTFSQVYDFTIIRISITFQYKIFQNIINIPGHLSSKSDNGLWPRRNKITACTQIISTFSRQFPHLMQSRITPYIIRSSRMRFKVFNIILIQYFKVIPPPP